MHNNKKGHFALFIISSIWVGRTIMLLKVLQAILTIGVIMSRVMFLLLEMLVVIMPSIILTVMWVLWMMLVKLKLFTTAVVLGLRYTLTIGWVWGTSLVIMTMAHHHPVKTTAFKLDGLIILSRVSLLLLGTLVVVMQSIIITLMWLLWTMLVTLNL